MSHSIAFLGPASRSCLLVQEMDISIVKVMEEITREQNKCISSVQQNVGEQGASYTIQCGLQMEKGYFKSRCGCY
jgi:hypothetical protein